MPRVDVPHLLISSAAIFGIRLVWYDFNKKVYERVLKLLDVIVCGTADEKKTRRKRLEEERRRRIEEEEEEERIIEEEMKIIEEEEKREKREKEIVRKMLKGMEQGLIRMGVGEEEIRRIRGEAVGGGGGERQINFVLNFCFYLYQPLSCPTTTL